MKSREQNLPSWPYCALSNKAIEGPMINPCTGKELSLSPTLLSQKEQLLSLFFRWKPYKVICCRPFIDQRRKTPDWNAENVFLKWLYQLFFLLVGLGGGGFGNKRSSCLSLPF